MHISLLECKQNKLPTYMVMLQFIGILHTNFKYLSKQNEVKARKPNKNKEIYKNNVSSISIL